MPERIPPSFSATDQQPTVVLRRSDNAVLEPGAVLGHTYVIEALLAHGGMGEVYRAMHIELGTVHAIKVILPRFANEVKFVHLLVEEARKLARVRNDAVVNYEGFFRCEGNLRYLVMEFIA